MPSGLCGILGGGGGGSAVASGLMGEVAVAGDVGSGYAAAWTGPPVFVWSW